MEQGRGIQQLAAYEGHDIAGNTKEILAPSANAWGGRTPLGISSMIIKSVG
jgi:hypothetical protein